MATSFGRIGHHQTISQNLKKAGIYVVQKRLFIWDPIYIYINIFINSLKMWYRLCPLWPKLVAINIINILLC